MNIAPGFYEYMAKGIEPDPDFWVGVSLSVDKGAYFAFPLTGNPDGWSEVRPENVLRIRAVDSEGIPTAYERLSEVREPRLPL